MIKRSLLIGILLFLSKDCMALEPPFDTAATITSWYGPRRHPANNSFQALHNGVDYGRDFGSPALAMQAGTIPQLGGVTLQGSSGYVLTFIGATGRWSYLHIFRNLSSTETLPITLANGWMLFQESGKLKIFRPQLTVNNIVYPPRVFSSDPGERQILTREPIAPVGNSGIGTGSAHLHLNFDGGLSNPLFHVNHTEGQPTISFLTLSANQILSQNELDNFLLSVQVNSNGASAGKDLDKIDVLVDNAIQRFPGQSQDRTFQFGGTPNENQIGIVSSTDGDGIEPILGDVFNPKFHRRLDLSQLTDGPHQMCVRTTNVKGNIIHQECVPFTIQRCGPGPDTTPPQIILDPSALQCINQPGSFDLAGIVSDNCSDPQLRLDGGSPEQLSPTSNPHEFSFNIPVTLDEGPNLFTLYAIDASSRTLQFPVTLNYDITPPFVHTFLPSPGALNVNPSAPIQAIFNEPLSSGEIVIEGTPVAGTSQLSGNVISFIHGPLPPDATFRVRVRNAMDQCGNCPQ